MHWTAAICAPVAVLALLVSACGDGDGGPIPSAQSAELIALLDETDRRMDARNACGDIESEDLPRLEEIAAGMSGEVDSDTRETLRDGVARLRELVDRECEEIRDERRREREREREEQEEPPPAPPEPQPEDDDREEKEREKAEKERERQEKEQEKEDDDDGGGGQQGPGGGAGEGGVRVPEGGGGE